MLQNMLGNKFGNVKRRTLFSTNLLHSFSARCTVVGCFCSFSLCSLNHFKASFFKRLIFCLANRSISIISEGMACTLHTHTDVMLSCISNRNKTPTQHVVPQRNMKLRTIYLLVGCCYLVIFLFF